MSATPADSASRAAGSLRPSRRAQTAALIASALALAVIAPGANAADYTVRLAHHLPTEAEQHKAAERFQELVAAKTDGRARVEILPAAQLGGQREIIESVTAGSIEMGFGESGLYAAYQPMFNIIALPYLYDGHEHWIEVVDGDVGEELEQALLDAAGVRIVNWLMTGYRDTYLRDRPVTEPADFEGLRIRLPEAEVFVQTFEAFGAVPTPVPAPEMYTALQTGLVDAMEGTPDVGWTWNIHEVTNYLSRTRHIFLDGSFIINEAFFQGLPEEVQAAILEAGVESASWQRAQHRDNEARFFGLLEQELEVNDVDLAAFAEVVAPLQDRVAERANATHLLETIRGLSARN